MSNYEINIATHHKIDISKTQNLKKLKQACDDFESEIKAGLNIGVIKLEAKTLEKIKDKKKNLFNELIEKLKKIDKTKILVIDEIQTLEDIYYNEEKELLKNLKKTIHYDNKF